MKPKSSTPRRIAGLILLSLALGLLTTLTAAWIIAYVGDSQQERVRSVAHWPRDTDQDGIQFAQWIPGKRCDFYYLNVAYAQSEHDDRDRAPEFVLPMWVKHAATPVPRIPTTPANSASWIIVHTCGWPYRALWCKFLPNPAAKTPTVSDGIELSRVTRRRGNYQWGEPAALPLRPAWSGLALDTILLGAAWLPVVFLVRGGAGHIRARIRVAHGRCPRCGYDLKNQPAPGCPECGWMRSDSSPGRSGGR